MILLIRDDFVEILAKKCELPKTTTYKLLDNFVESVYDALLEDDALKLRGLFAITIKPVPKRIARDPNTQEEITVKAKEKIHIALSDALRDNILEERRRRSKKVKAEESKQDRAKQRKKWLGE